MNVCLHPLPTLHSGAIKGAVCKIDDCCSFPGGQINTDGLGGDCPDIPTQSINIWLLGNETQHLTQCIFKPLQERRRTH